MNQAPANPLFFDNTLWDDLLESERQNFIRKAGSQAISLSPNYSSGFRSPYAHRSRPVAVNIISGIAGATAICLVQHLAVLRSTSSAQEREQAWKGLIQAVATSAVVGGAVAGTRDVMIRVLQDIKGQIMAQLFGEGATKGAMKAMSRLAGSMATGISAVASAIGTCALELAYACYYAITGRPHEAWKHLRQSWAELSLSSLLDKATLSAAGAMANVLVANALAHLPVLVGPVGAALTITLYALGQGVAWWVHYQVVGKETWKAWGGRLCRWEARRLQWISQLQQEFDLTPINLRCPLTLNMVHDPVRYRRTGQLYERHEIMRWVKDNGTDPLARESVTTKDYLDAPIAKGAAVQVAQILALRAVPVIDTA